ncbi:MAG TPA: hypothetical protein VK731_09525 [Candidatus Cybelea sp.]|jgi:hypothetical protein|nr:hypothetical protein [Candidatus Cybelea sp.]
MKINKSLIILAIATLTAVACHAQTIATNVPDLLPPSIGSGSLIGDLEAAGVDLYHDALTAKPYALADSQATLQLGGGVNTSTKNLVFAGILTVPMTNGVRIGAIIAHIGSQWYEGGANLSYGITKDYPVIGNATAFAGDGVVYDFITRNPANYAFSGFEKEWTINAHWKIGAGVVVANTSDRAGVDILGGLHATGHM